MQTGLKPKITIVGCGNVGIRYAYALLIRGLARQLVLIDANRNRAEGEAMDLSHGAPFMAPAEIAAGDYADAAGSDIVVVTAGLRQKPGQTRIDLVKENVGLFKTIIPEIVKHAPDALLLIISNPVDILSYAAWKISGKPAHTVIGSGTVLDSARFRYQLARHCAIDAHNIHAYILGEHGDSEFPVWSKAMIGSMLFTDYCLVCRNKGGCPDHGSVLDRIFTDVRDSAYKIIERKGETSYGIGLAASRITQAILHDENAILPVSSLVDGFLDISGVYLSIPAVVNRAGIREVLRMGLNEKEEAALRRSAATLKDVISMVGL